MAPLTKNVLTAVGEERDRQELKWGEQNHEAARYLAILAEEFGEVSEAVVHITFGGPLMLKSGAILETRNQIELHYMEELVQLAAVAVAMVECVLRHQPITRWVHGSTGTGRGVTRETGTGASKL